MQAYKLIFIASKAAVKRAKDEVSLKEQDISALVEMEDAAEAEEDDEPKILEELEDSLHHTSMLVIDSGHHRAVSATLTSYMTAFSMFLPIAACKFDYSAKQLPIVDPEGQAPTNQLLKVNLEQVRVHIICTVARLPAHSCR